MARALELLGALVRRGHGSPRRIRTEIGERLDRRRLPRSLRRARHYPEWSALNEAGGFAGARGAVVASLAAELDGSYWPGLSLESRDAHDPAD
jgi:hypothetical protein